MTKQIGPLLKVSDLDLMPDDGNIYELIDGELIVSRAPNLMHQSILDNLITEFKLYLRQHPIGKVWSTPGVIFNDSTGIIPDMVFVTNERLAEIEVGDKLVGTPTLITEILSPGPENAKRDREVKRQRYGRYGVEEYWIADPENHTIEIYRLHDQVLELIVILMAQDSITSPLLPGFNCQVGSLFKL